MLNVNVTDMEGYFIYVNTVFEERFKFITNKFLGYYSMDTIYHEDHEVCTKAVMECIENPLVPVKVELRKPLNNADTFEWTEWEFSYYLMKLGNL